MRRRKAARSLSDWCRIILLCAEGLESKQVSGRLAVHEHTAGKWRRRFVKDRIEGLTDEYRPGRPRTVSDEQVAEVTEFLDFLKQIDRRMPEGPHVHIVMDNHATHKTPKIKTWLARRPH